MKEKCPQDSYVMMSELVLPNDTNTLGNLMGGKLMHWMDIAAAIAAVPVRPRLRVLDDQITTIIL